MPICSCANGTLSLASIEIICSAIAAVATIIAVIIAQYRTKKLTYFQTYFDKKLSSYSEFWAAIAAYEADGESAWKQLSSAIHTVSLFAPEEIYEKILHMGNSVKDNRSLRGEEIETLISLMRDDLEKCKKMRF